MVIPTLAPIEIAGKTLTADALLTQTKLAAYAIERGAHYVFTIKANQPTLLADVTLNFQDRGAPDFQEPPTLSHGRIEQHGETTLTNNQR